MEIEGNKKSTFIDRMSVLFERFGMWCYDHRLIVMIFFILILLGSMFLASKLRIDNSNASFFELDDPVYATFLQYLEDYGPDELSYIMYDAPGFEYGPWNIEVMRKIEKLTKAIEDEVPFARKVSSLTNAEMIEGQGDRLIIYDISDKFPENQAEILKTRDRFLKKSMYVGGLASSDAKYGAIIIEMEKSSTDPIEELKLKPDGGNGFDNLFPHITNDRIEEILNRPEYAGINFHHTGQIPIGSIYNKTTQTTTGKMMAFSIILLCVILAYFFRNFIEVIAPIIVVFFTFMITLGFIKLVGWDLDIMVTILPTFILVVGVAASVHIISEFRSFQVQGIDKREAVKKTIFLLGVPCLFTSLTDAAGFLSMSVSPIKAIQHFAIFSAFGSVVAFLLSVSFLLVFISLVRKTPSSKEIEKMKKEGSRLNDIMAKIAHFDMRNKYAILAVSLMIAAVSIYGIFQMTVDTNMINEFSKEVEVRKATELVDSVMGGSMGYAYTFDTKKKDGILDPEVLKLMDSVSDAAKKESWIVMKTYSVVDLIKEVNRSFHGNDEKYYTIPESRDLIAQYLLLYETSGGNELKNYISSDYSRANLKIRFRYIDNSKFKEFNNKIDSFIKTLPDIKVASQKVGFGVLYLTMNDYIVDSQVNGFWLAFIGIGIMMCFLFKSVRLGILGMIPNVLPIMMTLGLMGLLKIPLDFIKVLIGCVSIGIAVDDTIHMLTRCRHEFNICGNYKEAILITIKDVGRAVYITTLVLVLGYAILVFSILDSVATFGLLVAFTIGIGLIVELFLTPTLLFVFKPYGPEFKPGS